MNDVKNILVFNNSHSEFNLLSTLSNFSNVKIYTVGKIIPKFKKKIIHKKIDYTDINQISNLIIRYKIKYLIPCANDLSLFTIVKLKNRKKNIFDNEKIISKIHDKFKFRKYENQFFRDSIKFSLSNKLHKLRELNFPILMKPKSGSGGKGIIKIESEEDLFKIKVPQKTNYFFEEFVPGTNHGIFTLIRDKKIIFTFYDTEQRFLNEYTVSSTNSICPFSKKTKLEFIKKVNKIIESLSLKDGILHFQVKHYKSNIKIIELTRRLPGDQYLKFVEIATGYPVIENIINIYLGIKTKSLASKRYYVLRKVVMADKNGCIKKIIINNQIRRNMIWRYDIKISGNHIKDYLNERIAVLIFKFKTKKELSHSTKFIDRLVNVSMK